MGMKILLFIVFLFSSIGFSEKASAFSCNPFTPDMMLGQIQYLMLGQIQSNPNLVVVQGNLDFEGKFNFTRDYTKSNDNGVFHSIDGLVSGVDLATGERFDRTIKLDQYCISVWCGGIQPMREKIFLINENDGEYVLPLDVCGGRVFTGFSDEHVQDIKECFQSGECGSDDLKEEKKESEE